MSGVVDIFTGKSADDASRAATQAADIQAEASLAGTEELRRQFDISQGQLQPFLQAGTSALPAFQQGTTVGGLDAQLAEIMGGDTFGSLLDERTRSVQGQLGAGGLTRSGAGLEAAAAIPTDLALQLEQMLFGRTQDLANMGQNTATGLGTLGQSSAQSIASQQNAAAQAQASGILGAQQAQAAGSQNLLNLGGSIGAAALMAPVGTFSDPLLKDNIRKIGKIKELDLIEWDWKEKFHDTIVSKFPTMGFMSTQVKEFYPEFIGEFGGFEIVNYNDLIKTLEAA